MVNLLFASSLSFYKLAADIEEAPDTERTPYYLDEQLQAYEFIGFLSILAQIKNQLSRAKHIHSMFNIVFGELVKLRPGVVRNAIKEMIDTDTFDKAVYLSLMGSMMKDIKATNLEQRLNELLEVIDIEALDGKLDIDFVDDLKDNIGKAIRIMSGGFQYR